MCGGKSVLYHASLEKVNTEAKSAQSVLKLLWRLRSNSKGLRRYVCKLVRGTHLFSP